ncbi:hypothetical protein GCM10019016_043990 [Streptomyces prasinosporus]|uniref:ABC transporter domain-containing protein n=1 Tax=Streptomyces prasinosporus TaxID=68256 RepID=A0ABP6TPS2_9ACTN
MTPTVSASGLSLRYGARPAPWTTCRCGCPRASPGCSGPNGAGKTTLLRVLATAVPADRGAFTVLGHDPGTARGRQEVRRRLGYLPADARLPSRTSPPSSSSTTWRSSRS